LSLRFRLNLTIALTVLTMLGLGAAFVMHNARRSVEAEMRSSVNMALQLIDIGRIRAGSDRAWLAELARLEKTRHLRIHLSRTPETLTEAKASAATREATDAPAWFAWAVAPERITGEKWVEDPSGGRVGIFVESDPNDEIAEAWGEARDLFVLLLILAVSVCVLVHFTLGRAFKSVSLILKGLEDIERGDYNRRLPRFPLAEFEQISSAFNHAVAALALAREENRALARRSLTIQEEERRFLAREMHDELGQSLSAIKLMAVSLRVSAQDSRSREAANAIVAESDRLFGVVRALMRRLRPLTLDDFGLVAALEDMVAAWSERNPATRVEFRCSPEVETLAGDARIDLFRIVQECLTNVAKHAGAANVDIRLGAQDGAGGKTLTLSCADDGRGIDPALEQSGFGLHGMRERVSSLCGAFRLTSAAGAGVRVEIEIPASR
jgi:two-component system sensor histidine kinase UhpB